LYGGIFCTIGIEYPLFVGNIPLFLGLGRYPTFHEKHDLSVLKFLWPLHEIVGSHHHSTLFQVGVKTITNFDVHLLNLIYICKA
jgi:hypothetical protein